MGRMLQFCTMSGVTSGNLAASSAPSVDTPSESMWPIVGHRWAVHLLRRSLQTTGPRHAYLFLGPPQVGKRTLARVFAQSLLCTAPGPNQRPCGECRACRLTARDGHPDLQWVQPLDRDGVVDRANGMLKVEQAAGIIHDAALRPLEGRYKVFIIQDAHTANDSFANKLLKTLEEPPEHVVLLLTALDRSSLLPTILSRCQVFELRPLPTEQVAQALVERWQVAPPQADLLARLANGRLGWAVDQLDDADGMGRRQTQLEQLLRLVAANRIERLDFAEQTASGRNNHALFAMLELWTTWWRDVLLAQVGCLEACSNIDQQAEIARQATALTPQQVRDYLLTLHRIDGYLHHTVNTRLALDVLLLQLPHVAPE